MILSTHAVAGALVGSVVAYNPFLAGALGFASHFILDAVPHWDYPLKSSQKDLNNRMNNTVIMGKSFIFDLAKIGLDMLVGAVVVFLAFSNAPTTVFWGACIGAVFAVLPDFLQFVYFRYPHEPMRSLQKFHVVMVHAKTDYNDRPIIGIFFQAALIAIIFFLAYGILFPREKEKEAVALVATENPTFVSLRTQLAEMQADLRNKQSKLDELETSINIKQIEIIRAKAKTAKVKIDNANRSLVVALNDAYATTSDAIHNNADNFFINPESSPQLVFSSTTISEASLESGRIEVGKRLLSMNSALEALGSTSDATLVLKKIKLDLGEIKLFLDNLFLSTDAVSSVPYLPESIFVGWKSDLYKARNNLNSALTAVLSGEDKLILAQSAYIKLSEELAFKTGDVIEQEVGKQKAAVENMQSAIASLQAQINQIK